MKSSRQAVTILIHRDGAVHSRSLRFPLWVVRTILFGGGAVLALLVVLIVLYGPIYGVAARVPGLQSEIGRLRTENAQIHRLRAAVDSLESQYSKVRGMLGADVSDPAPTDRQPLEAPTILVSGGTHADRNGELQRWPLDQGGYVTRGQLGAAEDPTHAGIDIAVPTGTPVRASGAGDVLEATTDSEYGNYVLLRHPNALTSRYAHLARILVRQGESVAAGTVIGLSGSSGRSSAPHLHFEIRRNGQSIDPLSQIQEGH